MIDIYDNSCPNGWDEDELREISIRKRGYSWTKDDETNIPDETTVPVLRIPNIQKKLDLNDLLYLRNVSQEALLNSAVEKGWILFVGSNGNPDRIGDSALMTIDRPMVFASFLMGLASKQTERITPEFLAYWMRLHSVHEVFSKTSQKTTGLANFSWSAVKRLPIRFPVDVREQEAITHLIDIADSVIGTAEMKLIAAHRLKKALMQQLFTRGIAGRHKGFKNARVFRYEFIVPDEWDVSHLRNSLISIEYGTNQASNDRKQGLPVIAIPEVISSRFRLGECSYAEVSENEASSLRLFPDDVLLIRTNGNSDYIGKSTVIGDEAKEQHIIFASYLIRVRTDKDFLSGRYLNYFLASPLGRRQCLAMANTSAGNHNLGKRSIKQFCFPRPSPNEQEDIVNLVDAAEDLIETVENEILALEYLKKSLLQNLITGRVRVRK